MTCIHIQKVKNLLTNTTSIRNEIFNINITGNSSFLLRGNCGCADCYEVGCQRKKEILNILNQCNCVETKEWGINELRRKTGNLESNQLVLARDKSNVEISLIRIQSEKDSLQSSNWSLQKDKDDLKEQIREKSELIRTGERVLQTAQSQLTTVQNQLARKINDYDDLNRRFNFLQIENTNKDNEITSLQEELKGSQNIDLRYKERKLDKLVRNSGLNRIRVINLRDAYERLMKAQEDYNLNNITNANNEIETIKAEFFQTNVNIDDLHKIYKTCEKIAELRVKQEKLHEQRFEARQEAPPRH